MSDQKETKAEPAADRQGRLEALVRCGKCGKEWGANDFVEIQECLHKHDIGGYGSVFGDGREWEVTLCQSCAREILEPYIIWHDCA